MLNIATVPPTVALVADRFGRAHVGAVFASLMALLVRREVAPPGAEPVRA